MLLSLRKFVALLLVIWLPLFSGATLAGSVSMQLPHDTCHEMKQDDQLLVYSNTVHPSDQHSTSCDQCSICHPASGSYLGVKQIPTLKTMQVVALVTPYLFSFHSIISASVLAPPLV